MHPVSVKVGISFRINSRTRHLLEHTEHTSVRHGPTGKKCRVIQGHSSMTHARYTVGCHRNIQITSAVWGSRLHKKRDNLWRFQRRFRFLSGIVRVGTGNGSS